MLYIRKLIAPIIAGVQKALTFVSGTQTLVLDPTNGLDLTNCGLKLSKQVWNLTASRAAKVTYYNNTKKDIFCVITLTSTLGENSFLQIDGGSSFSSGDAAGQTHVLVGFVPPGSSYIVTLGGTATIQMWTEYR